MALKDLETFVRERLQIWNPDLDISVGSPIDTALIQPLLARVGSDPFSTNLPLFVRETLSRKFPNLAITDIDELSDLLAKPFELLLAPVVRETNRIALSQSFADPSLLTRDEAQALGSNYFDSIDEGKVSRGTMRLYYSSPRPARATPANYGYTSTGLTFPPSYTQEIRADEMLLNVEGTEYYFDVEVEAAAAGDQYNIEAGALRGVADMPGVVRVVNKRRFREGVPSESAVEYIDRLNRQQSEQSMVSARGIFTKVFRAFPEVTRLSIVGMGDPEMQRDVLQGGGFGSVTAAGDLLSATSDGRHGMYTSYVRVADPVDFTRLIGPAGPVSSGYSLTIYGAFASGTDTIQDVEVTRVVDSVTLGLSDSVVLGGATNKPWALRKRSLTLSGIPGGVLFPNGPNGTVEVEDGVVHIGGATDVYIRGTSLDESSLILDNVSDDEPGLEGTAYRTLLTGHPVVILSNYTFYDQGVGNLATSNYQLLDDDPVYSFLKSCPKNRYLFKISYPPAAAGTYRIMRVWQTPSNTINQHPVLELDRAPGSAFGYESGGSVINPITWKIQDDIDVNLVEPKETRWEGSDLQTSTGADIVTSANGIDFSSLGTSAGDILRILSGGDAGDHTVVAATGAGGSQIQLSSPLQHSASSLSYILFRSNSAGGLELPLVRVTSVELLDAGKQPIGSPVPYGKPVYCRTSSFANYARGTKLEVRDACVGCVGAVQPLSGGVPYVPSIAGKNIKISWKVYGTLDISGYTDELTITFPGGTNTLQDVVNIINTALIGHVGAQVGAAYIVQGRRLGIAPLGPETKIWDTGVGAGTGYKLLFGTYNTDYVRWLPPITSRDIRSDTVSGAIIDPNRDNGWVDDKYDIDRPVDGVDVRSGTQAGHYSMEYSWKVSSTSLEPCIMLQNDLRPESDVHVVVGSRSIGYMRLYFMDPLTIELGPSTRFHVTESTGVVREFFPDPTLSSTRIPAPPQTEEPKDAVFTVTGPTINTATGRMSSASTDFVEEAVTVGDFVEVKYETLYGGVLAADVANLAGKILKISYDNSPDVSVQFEATSVVGAIEYVSQAAVASQINDALGVDIASVTLTVLGDTLTFDADVSVVVRYSAESFAANTVLGIAAAQDANNQARNLGTYLVTSVVDENTLELQRLEGAIDWINVDPTTTPDRVVPQHFSVTRHETQRFGVTEMAARPTSFGLYYVDVEASSRGVGDSWNVVADMEATVSGYTSYGYYVDSPENVSYSMIDTPKLRLPPVIFPSGSDDSVSSALDVVGQNVQVSYERSSLVAGVQSFALEELERVTNSSMLVRHLLPHFVRLYLEYTGGDKSDQILRDLEAHVKKLYPNQYLQASDIQGVLTRRGAKYITNPTAVMALVHQLDREIWAQWSNDRINTDGRLASFIPDLLTLVRKG